MQARLGRTPFAVAPDCVSLLSGEDEGAFMWLTLNYLLGNLAGGDLSARG